MVKQKTTRLPWFFFVNCHVVDSFDFIAKCVFIFSSYILYVLSSITLSLSSTSFPGVSLDMSVNVLMQTTITTSLTVGGGFDTLFNALHVMCYMVLKTMCQVLIHNSAW